MNQNERYGTFGSCFHIWWGYRWDRQAVVPIYPVRSKLHTLFRAVISLSDIPTLRRCLLLTITKPLNILCSVLRGGRGGRGGRNLTSLEEVRNPVTRDIQEADYTYGSQVPLLASCTDLDFWFTEMKTKEMLGRKLPSIVFKN